MALKQTNPAGVAPAGFVDYGDASSWMGDGA